MPDLTTVYATDEDVLIRCPGDFALLARGQEYAAGKDGVFASDDRWTLTSASVDFADQGVLPSMVAFVTKSGSLASGGSGVPFVVDSVSGNAMTLRRRGAASGVGQPPGDAGGMTGVAFSVLTLAPQIEDVSYELNRVYGIDDAVPYRTAGDLYDVREIRQLCVLKTVYRLYIDAARAGQGDVFYAKAGEIMGQIQELSASVTVRWGRDERFNPPSTKFGMRISR